MMKNLKLLGVLLVGLFMPILVNAETCTENCVAQIGDTKYATVQEAITAVEDGGTVELLAGDISENISTGRIAKSFSIIGAANHATTLTGGLTIGTDHSSKPVQEYTVTIKGIVFKNNGIAVKDVKNVNIEDNKLYNIAEGAAIYIIDSAIHDVVSDVVAKNNIVDGANQGIRIRTGYNMEITDNIIKNTQHNSITIEHGSKWSGNNGTVVINNNTFENWALGGEGRVVRAHFGTATEFNKEISFTGNKMIREEEPVEENPAEVAEVKEDDKTAVVKASADGTVKSIKNDPRYGLTVVLEHQSGFTSVYANLLTAEFVAQGETVKAGQTLGTVGNSATFEILDDSHLHFEILKDGNNVDPEMYVK